MTTPALNEALAKARAEFKEFRQDRTAKIASKKGEGSSYSYSYSTLAEIHEAIYPALSSHGLSITTPIEVRDGSLIAVVQLRHESGEWIESIYPLQQMAPKDLGGYLKSLRRHLICGLLDIAPIESDDDPVRNEGARLTPAPIGRKSQEQKPAHVQFINNRMKELRLSVQDVLEISRSHGLPENIYELTQEQTESLVRSMELHAETLVAAN